MAFEEIRETRNRQHELIVAYLKVVREANNSLISNGTGLPINVITPRVNELRRMRLVIYAGTRVCPFTGRQTMWWRVKDSVLDGDLLSIPGNEEGEHPISVESQH